MNNLVIILVAGVAVGLGVYIYGLYTGRSGYSGPDLPLKGDGAVVVGVGLVINCGVALMITLV